MAPSPRKVAKLLFINSRDRKADTSFPLRRSAMRRALRPGRRFRTRTHYPELCRGIANPGVLPRNLVSAVCPCHLQRPRMVLQGARGQQNRRHVAEKKSIIQQRMYSVNRNVLAAITRTPCGNVKPKETPTPHEHTTSDHDT